MEQVEACWLEEEPHFAIVVFSFVLQGVYSHRHALNQLAIRVLKAVTEVLGVAIVQEGVTFLRKVVI